MYGNESSKDVRSSHGNVFCFFFINHMSRATRNLSHIFVLSYDDIFKAPMNKQCCLQTTRSTDFNLEVLVFTQFIKSFQRYVSGRLGLQLLSEDTWFQHDFSQIYQVDWPKFSMSLNAEIPESNLWWLLYVWKVECFVMSTNACLTLL